MFSRVLAFYGFGDVQKLRKLPLVTFWMLSRNIDRISAEQDIRRAKIGLQVQSGEGFQALIKELQQQIGKVMEFDQKRVALKAKRDEITEEDRNWINGAGALTK